MDNSTIDFSVIVLCYNPNIEKLRKTIVSIIKQEGVSFEVLICDDGSKNSYEEELRKWCAQFRGVNFTYLFPKENQGTVRNYLSGIKKSRGLYVKPISPGDYMFDSMSLYEFKKAFAFNPDVIFSDCVSYNEQKVVSNKTFPKSYKLYNKNCNMKKEYIFYQNHFVGATMCVKKGVVERILDNAKERVTLSEDYTLMTQALMDGCNIIPIRKRLMWYEYETGGSATNSFFSKTVKDDMIRTNNYLMDRYRDDKVIKKLIKIRDIRAPKRNNSTFKKFFSYLIYCPEYIIREIIFRLRIVKKPNVDINKIKEITNV